MNKEMILDALKSRYSFLKEPLPLASAILHQVLNRRYLTSLRVFGTQEDHEPQSSQNLSQNIMDPQILKKKITAAIAAMSFQDPQVFVQFWSPLTVKKRCVLTTWDQPFGIGVVNEAFYSYRLESEERMFAVDGDEHMIEKLGSPARVYRQKLPEWSLDLKGLSTNQNIKDSTAFYNIHGYIILPVLEPASGCCVGVLELVTLSKHVDFAFEVLEISKALKEQDFKTSNVFEDPSFCELPSEDRQIQIWKINNILKVMCDTHNLPLAQTWELSPLGSHVSHEKSIQKSCSSFNRRCIGKVCISTAGLPFYVRDQRMWKFHKACTEQHLEKSRGVVGRALLSHCLSYCENVTKLIEEEYPLVRIACTSGLGGCFAIFLHGVEGKNDYILEFFMPLDIMDSIDSYVLNFVQKLKLKFEYASGFEMGDISSIEVIRPPSVVNYISSMTEFDTPNEIIPHRSVTDVATPVCGAYANVSTQKTRDKGNDAGEPSNRLRRNIKRKRDSLTMESVEKQVGQQMDEASKSLGVSRSTLKRFLRAHGISRWPMLSKPSDRSARVPHSNQHLPVSKVIRPPSVVNNVSSMTDFDTPNEIIPYRSVTNVATTVCGAYANVSMQKTRDKGNDAGEPSNRLIQNIKCKRGSLTVESFEKQVGKQMDEASKSIGEFDTPNEIIPHQFVTNVATTVCGAYANVSLQKTRDKGNDAGEPSNRLTLNKKPKRDSLTMEAVEKQGGQPMDEASKNLGVSRSTLKRFLRDHRIPRWPMSSKLSDRNHLPTSTYYRLVFLLSTVTLTSTYLGRTIDWKQWLPKNINRLILDESTTIGYHVTITEQATYNVDPLTARTAMAYQYYPVFFDSTTYTEQATYNVDALMARTAIAHQNDPVVFDSTTNMEQATNNVDPLMDVHWNSVTNLNLVDASRRSSGADFFDGPGSYLLMAGCSSDSGLDYLMEPDRIENAMVETGSGLEGAWPPPIGSGDMDLFSASTSDYDFSNLVFDD